MPLLRFKADDGNDYPDWEEKTLVEVCDIIGGGTPSTQEPAYWNGDIQWFTPTEINTKYVSNSDRTITNLGLQKSSAKLLPAGTVLVTTRATLGKMAIATKDCTTNQGFHSLIAHDCCNNEFLYYLQPIIKEYCLTHHSVTTFKETSKSLLEQCVIPIPSLSEQQKIADFLSAVDAQIEHYQQYLNNLEAQKKTLLHQVFAQVIRFTKDDGNDYSDWEETTVGEAFTITRGKVLAKDKIKSNYSNEYQYPVYSSQTLNNGLFGYYTEYLYEDCITWTTDGANAGTVRYRSGKFYCTNVCGVLLPKKLIPNRFFAEILNFTCQRLIKKVDNCKLMNNDIKPALLYVPCVEEQIKISQFFDAFDERIELERQRLQTMQELKKGLLHQMFC